MSDEANNLEQRITFDSISLLYNSMVNKCFGSTVFILIMLAALWDDERAIISLSWGALMLLAVVAQEVLVRAFVAADVQVNQIEVWKKRLLLSYLSFGLLWASTVVIFYNNYSVEHQTFLVTMLISVSVGGIFSRMHFMELYYVYSLPIYAALILRFLMEGTFSYIVLALLMLWGFLFSMRVSKQMNQTMRTTMRLKYESSILSDQLKIKSDEAHQASQAKSRFLAAASHDLRQPLHALSLFVDVLKEAQSDKERENIFPRLDLSLNVLRKLFDALLDVSKLDANVIKPEIRHFDLAELLKDMEEEFGDLARKKNLKLHVYAATQIVISDRILLERIVRNLITNAIRYTETGGVLLSARLRGDTVLLQIWDTGIGIPEESHDEIFVEFQQLHNTSRDRTQGLGLGLALVRRLCVLLKHSFTLRSNVGKGSVFNVYIPRGSNSLIVSSDESIVSHSWNLSGRRILVIDDEQEILIAMQTLLTKWGCELTIAESLDDAVKQLHDNHMMPELIISDLRLRDNKTGIEAIEGIRELFSELIPGVLITGETEPEQLIKVNQSGLKVLQKPIKPIHLRSYIQSQFADTEG